MIQHILVGDSLFNHTPWVFAMLSLSCTVFHYKHIFTNAHNNITTLRVKQYYKYTYNVTFQVHNHVPLPVAWHVSKKRPMQCQNSGLEWILYLKLSLSLICSKFYWLFFPARVATHYSHFILISLPVISLCLLFQVLTSRETWTLCIFYYSYCVNVRYVYTYKYNVHAYGQWKPSLPYLKLLPD